MKAILKDSVIEILHDDSEELSIYRETIYSDRIVVFKTIAKDIYQEIHFSKSTADLIDRECRKEKLYKTEYFFNDSQIKVIIEHKFLDELDFPDFKPNGIDVETIIVRLLKDDIELNSYLHLHPVNKYPETYFETARDSVERYLEVEKSNLEHKNFLLNTYSKWTTKEKANYHYGAILFQDRMQGGEPSRFTNPAADYLSKWFIETYQPYDNDILSTLRLIAEMFEIDTIYINEMIKYKSNSSEWNYYASKLNLINR